MKLFTKSKIQYINQANVWNFENFHNKNDILSFDIWHTQGWYPRKNFTSTHGSNIKRLQLKHTKYMYVFKIKKKVIIQWTYSILTLEVWIMSRTRLSWYTVQPPDKRHLATSKFWCKVIATAHKGTHQSGIMFLQTTKHAHKQRMKCFCAGLHPKRCMCECKDKRWDCLCMKQNTGV